MRNNFMLSFIIIAIALNTAGCGTVTERMNRLSINMDKKEVRSLFGAQFTSKASKVDADGNILDLWEYYDKKTKSTYQIYFLNDKISQWGKSDELKAFPELHAPGKKKQSAE